MSSQCFDNIQLAIPKVLEQVPYLKLLILFGSRAKGNDTPNSDWDFAVLFDEEIRKQYEKDTWDWMRIWSILQTEFCLSDDQIDIVILNQCSNVLAHNIARYGKPLYEKNSGEFDKFRAKAFMNKEAQKAYIAEKRVEVRAALARWKA
jgi:predicted nucleotidyltransferase